ncbi:MORC family CW-type Zinc finger protein 3 [Plakobranchus ocellatus]|uniref:MORC family CW-type Zinc finger protein 3 n=1 Tax=Plakobranchus ocellatus TaxID=259542 RepID=A0AAV4B0F9_9GAST|nr:MORC family CW-type Zinc finger protein 3 [Plakobranchus ocellatus]
MEHDGSRESQYNLNAILKHSVFNSEDELKEQLNSLLKSRKTTKIIISNLKKMDDGELELDFSSDEKDIRCREADLTSTGLATSKYRTSLRAYCSILFLKPRMKIIIRREKVKTKIISKSLGRTMKDSYQPYNSKSEEKKHVPITFGFSCEKGRDENYGMMLYYKNRLIKAFLHVGYQKHPDDRGIGVVGVVDVDFLQPIHNKQDFIEDNKYNLAMRAFATKLNAYFDKVTNAGTSSGTQPDMQHVQCDKCLKWRRLPDTFDMDTLPKKWYCENNFDANYKSCSIPEQTDDEVAAQTKKDQRQGKRQSKSLETEAEKKLLTKLFFISVLAKEGKQSSLISFLGQPDINKQSSLISFLGQPDINNLNIIQVYAPTSACSDDDIEKFYEELEEARTQCSQQNPLIIMGDFNAKVGEGREENIVGPHGLGTRNLRGEKLVEWCKMNNLIIGNTWFQQPPRRKWTWKSPGEEIRNQIDFILLSHRFRNALLSAKSYPGADCYSDHAPVIAKYKVKLKKTHRKIINIKLNLATLKSNQAIREKYCIAVQNNFETLGEAEEVDQQWEDFKAAVTEAAEKEIPKGTRKAKQRWMTEDILKIMDKRRLAKDNKEEYETLQKVIRKKCDEAKENWINDKCNCIDLHCRSTPQVMYRNIDEITGKKTCSSTGCLKSKNGDIIMEKEKILERWEEYISELGATECELHRTISLMSHVTKLLLRIIMMRVRNKIKPEIAEEQCGFVEGKAKKTNDTVLEEAHTRRLLISKIRKRQATFFGHVMRREKLENLVTTGMLEGKRSRGKQREKLIEGLIDWLKAGKSLEAIEATKDRKKWRTMIANAVKQGT